LPEASDNDDLALLETHVRAAGEIARGYFGKSYKHWDKGPRQPVTEADIAVDRYLMAHLRTARPGYGWLSEESRDDPARLTAKTLFIVDPIDGTIAFMKNRPHFTICAALVRAGRPAAGVVYNPIEEEFFSARKGGGAHLNGAPIHVSTRDRIEGCTMLGDRTMFTHTRWSNPPFTPWPSMMIENRSSVAYRMALVAGGGWDAMLALSAKRDWDLAAAEIICAEAGGIVSSHTGTPLLYNSPGAVLPSVVAAGPALHARLLEHLKPVTLP
jgi:myo-inositol-1(or 4)-monophosphatase